jgi:ABC-2 type transport system ATP-binding protein
VPHPQNSASSSDAIAVQVLGLAKRYRNGVLANDGIDLSVAQGTVFGLLGRNGAGKTTLVRQITAELQPTAGEVRVQGVDVLREPLSAKRFMGVVPQEAAPYLHLTPREHLRLFGRLHGLSRSRARQRAEELMAALDLDAHAGVTVNQLSGGLKRKLLVGNALMADPPVLVLDEPTTGLDPHSRREVWALIRGFSARGATILITTHYMEEAEALCDEVAIISGGRILAQGTVEELRARCRYRYKATFTIANGREESIAGRSHEEVVDELARLGVREFAINKASLEDLYLELTGADLTGENSGQGDQ